MSHDKATLDLLKLELADIKAATKRIKRETVRINRTAAKLVLAKEQFRKATARLADVAGFYRPNGNNSSWTDAE